METVVLKADFFMGPVNELVISSAIAVAFALAQNRGELRMLIGGEDAPIPTEEIGTHAPGGVELDIHEGGQPSWWWLLAAQ